MKKKSKKIVKKVAKETARWGVRELIKRKLLRQREVIAVPCDVINRFKFFLAEYEHLFMKGYSYNILCIIHSVAAPLKSSYQISEKLKHFDEKYRWVEEGLHQAKSALKNFEKYGEREWFLKATEHLYEVIKKYVGFAEYLDDLLLMCNKPQTLNNALTTLDNLYTPLREYYNHLTQDYLQFAKKNSSYVYGIPSGDCGHKFMNDLSFPEVPSKICMLKLLERYEHKEVFKS
jgi:hypothetical protein